MERPDDPRLKRSASDRVGAVPISSWPGLDVDGAAGDDTASAPLLEARDIIAVDDDPRNLIAIEAALGPYASRLVLARSGIDALRHLLQGEFAVILLDVRMPTLDGFETARLIRTRQRSRHVPIIFMTAYRDADVDVRRGYDLGAVDYLFKPFVPEVLQAKVKVFVALHERTEQVARQAERLFVLERAAAERRLEDERRAWEALALRRQMEEQRDINRRLEGADRQKDEFIAMLAHELRNPLVPIVASIELLRTQPADRAMLDRVREAMERQVGHLTRMVDDLLDVVRVDRAKVDLQRESLRLGEVVGWAAETCRERLEARQLTLTIEQPESEVHVDADPVRLTQVISNLLANACRYSPPARRIWVTWHREGTDAVIRVQDEGNGIAAELLDRVFDRFVQGRKDGRGLGLGLTLVKQIIELHSGSVTVESEGEDRGSVFTVRLPALEASAVVAVRSRAPTSSESRLMRPRDVLIVEDDADVRATMGWLLSSWGHRVRLAPNAERALELMFGEPPEVALIDIGLPGLDGYGLAERIREKFGGASPRLIALSGYGCPRDLERSDQAGFDEHLVKPASMEALRAVLAREDSPSHDEKALRDD